METFLNLVNKTLNVCFFPKSAQRVSWDTEKHSTDGRKKKKKHCSYHINCPMDIKLSNTEERTGLQGLASVW